MALNRKYANLPDLDSAPDIYETPDLTDDNSTIPTTAHRAASEDGLYDVDDEDQEISRSRLRIDEARARFLPAGVDANGVDFSDRVDGKRKSYMASSRRQRTLRNGTEEYGDLSDEDDGDEGLERRIARLQREVEETKAAVEQRRSEAKPAKDDAEGNTLQLEGLSAVLDQLSQSTALISSENQHRSVPARDAAAAAPDMAGNEATYTLTYAPAYEQTHALAMAADFDRRLLMLEQGLGISSTSALESAGSGLPRAVLPTLDTLEKQISTLASASTASLDAISRRVRSLAQDQEKLNEQRRQAKSLREELGKNGNGQGSEINEQEDKINALYGTLPTIESLTPMLTPLLDRLRSLRAIHTDAATASETLELLEQEQLELADEIKQWREGLEKIEGAVQDGDIVVKGNMKVMEGWVKALEERMAKLA